MKADVIRIPGLTDLVSTAAGEASLMARLGVLETGRSQFNATLLDGGDGSEGSGEEWETRQLTMTGLPEILMTYAHFVAAWLDVPVTKLMNSPPKGMNATGEYDDKNYASSIKARQVTELQPRLEALDGYLFNSAGVKQTQDTTWEFVPLQEVSAKEASEIELNEAKALDFIASSGLIPTDALSKVLVNRMEESGRWPGIAEAVQESAEELPAERKARLEEQSGAAQNDNTPRAVAVAGRGSSQRMTVRRPGAGSMQDAAPRTLYVSRRVMNPQEILRWARENNLPDLQKASDLHVTVAYSRRPVDWLKMPSDWSGGEDGRLRIPPGGARLIERLGDGSAVVLSFSNDQLAWRNKAFQEAGCSWDWPDYVPHITLSWNVPRDFDLSAVKPYQGRIVLSPERFEEIV
jgi:2'-5' RNA ligase